MYVCMYVFLHLSYANQKMLYKHMFANTSLSSLTTIILHISYRKNEKVEKEIFYFYPFP